MSKIKKQTYKGASPTRYLNNRALGGLIATSIVCVGIETSK